MASDTAAREPSTGATLRLARASTGMTTSDRAARTMPGILASGSDACSVAAAAIHHQRLRPVALEDQTVIFRLLSDRRDDLGSDRRTAFAATFDAANPWD